MCVRQVRIHQEFGSFDDLGSRGRASGMLLRQCSFPLTYDGSLDTLIADDTDRCLDRDFKHTVECFRKHTGTGPQALPTWLYRATDSQVIALLNAVLKGDTEGVQWTGYRVLGTVNRIYGEAVYTLELFAKHPESRTRVETIFALR